MLPVTQHQKWHVPHSLALGAALLALTLAFVNPAAILPSDESIDEPATVQRTDEVTEDHHASVAAKPETPPSGQGAAILSDLLPLVLPYGRGH